LKCLHVSGAKRSSILSPFLFSILVFLVVVVMSERARPQSSTDEYRVKAAFLFHFAQLVDWPSNALGDGKNPFTVCTVGGDPFHGALDTAVEGKPIGPRTMHVHHLSQIEEVRDCRIVFVGRSESKRIPAVLAELEKTPVMTVGETDARPPGGGIIGFCLEDNKVRFEINLAAAERVKLTISSRLLLLAKSVER
jgi:hypothetical protein